MQDAPLNPTSKRYQPTIGEHLNSFFTYIRSHIARRMMVCLAVLLIIAIIVSNFLVPTLGHQSATGGYYTDWFVVNGVLVHENTDFRTQSSILELPYVFKMRSVNTSRLMAFREYFNWGTLGFLITKVNVGSGRRIMADLVILPLWPVPAILFLILLFGYRRSNIRKQEHAAGLCPVCGYDLRASPERCPECGTIRNPITQ